MKTIVTDQEVLEVLKLDLVTTENSGKTKACDSVGIRAILGSACALHVPKLYNP